MNEKEKYYNTTMEMIANEIESGNKNVFHDLIKKIEDRALKAMWEKFHPMCYVRHSGAKEGRYNCGHKELFKPMEPLAPCSFDTCPIVREAREELERGGK